MFKKALYSILGLLAALICVVVVRTILLQPEKPPQITADLPGVDADKTAAILAGALRIATVSHPDAALDKKEEFREFHAYLARSFPKAHAALTKETIECCSLLYVWKGKNPSLKPVLLMAHMDVVPVEPGTESKWEHAPFSGTIKDGFVWGRGTLDDKGNLITVLAAAEQLVTAGFQPERSIYFAFGQDEEVGGYRGSHSVAETLAKRGITFEFVLDEGGSVTQGIVGGVKEPIALIGIVEKGYVTLRLTAHGKGGHASTPPAYTAAGAIGRALFRLEEHPFPSRMTETTRKMLLAVGPHMPFAQKMAVANLWLFERIIMGQMGKTPATIAGLRTTTAPTMLLGSPQENVLPSEATAAVNFRILPGESTTSTLERAGKIINDPDITIVALRPFISEPSKVSSTDGIGFQLVKKHTLHLYPNAVVSPMMVLGATDSRHYEAIADNTYRFFPFLLGADDLVRAHGTNERVSVENLGRGVQFYQMLMRDL